MASRHSADQLLHLFQALYRQETTPSKAIESFKFFPYEDLGMAKTDLHRNFRTGFSEIIFCEGKTTEQVLLIAQKICKAHGYVVASRISKPQTSALKKQFKKKMKYFAQARVAVVGNLPARTLKPGILVLSAGTADIPVAEEAAVIAEVMGNRVKRVYDVGAAGVHRLLDNREEIERNRVLIVVAGMDGVLPTVVAGIFGKPVIAVPTSIGYGAHFGGAVPLLTMLNSCAPGIVVVNIDNGLGAGYFASLLNHL